MKETQEISEVRLALEHCLGQVPEALGRRLRSEAELCETFRMGRWHLRRALDAMVRDGILAKRRGSGTFVKRVPAKSLRSTVHAVTPEQVFSNPTYSEPLTMLPRRAACTHWKLELWGDWSSTDRSSQATLAGMIERANNQGHRLTAHSSLLPSGEQMEPSAVVQAVNDSGCDGAIFGLNYFDAHAQAFVHCRKPIVLHYAGSTPLRDGPLVSLDTEGGVEQAVRVFAREGRSRVAVIGLDTPYHPAQAERTALIRTAKTAGITTAGFHGCDYRDAESCRAAIRNALAAKADAIYVADDMILSPVVHALREGNVVPGRDLALISLSNRGVPLANGHDWSRLELDGWLFGRMVVDALTIHLESGGAQRPCMQVRLNWIPGTTHGGRVP